MEALEGKLSPGTTIPKEEDHPQAYEESKRGGWITIPFITGSMMGLSIAAAGWASNLIVFSITEFNVKSITATKISNVVLGCSNLFPLASAIIADSFFGSFPVVCFFAFVSLLGMIMFTLMSTIHTLRPAPCAIGSYSCETPSNLQYAVLYMTLTLASLGLGGTRFTISTMGAQQLDKNKDQATFFGWYYLTLYVANIISFTAIIYIQDSVSWGLGFALCALANAIGLAALVLGKRLYRHVKPKGSPFTSIARVLVAAIRKRKASGTSFGSQDYYYSGTSTQMLKMEDSSSTRRFRFLNRAALKTESDKQSDGSYARSWRLCTMEEVEDLKSVLKIMPLWSAGISLCTALGIFSSLTILQAMTMDRHLGPHFKIPAASLLVFNLLGTTISIFLIDNYLLPTWQILTRRYMTPLQRIGTGHVISILAFVGSALIETRRLHVIRAHKLGGQPGMIVPMSALWLALPLVTIGFGEGFYVPGSVLYYQEFPESLKSTSTAIVSLVIGIGLCLSTAIMDLIDRTTGWLPDNINDGRLDYVYWVLVAMAVVNFGYFLICAKLFKYQREDDHDHGPSGLAH